MASIDIQVPDIGDFDEVTVIELMVAVGDTIRAEQSLITVESDKASMEIPSSAGGVVTAIKVAVGDKVKQGSVVLTIEAAAGAAAAPAAAKARPAFFPKSPTLSPKVLTSVSADLRFFVKLSTSANSLSVNARVPVAISPTPSIFC